MKIQALMTLVDIEAGCFSRDQVTNMNDKLASRYIAAGVAVETKKAIKPKSKVVESNDE